MNTDDLITSWNEMHALIGHHVTVVLDLSEDGAIITGKLLDLTDDGEAKVQLDDGKVMYAWPAMGIEQPSK